MLVLSIAEDEDGPYWRKTKAVIGKGDKRDLRLFYVDGRDTRPYTLDGATTLDSESGQNEEYVTSKESNGNQEEQYWKVRFKKKIDNVTDSDLKLWLWATVPDMVGSQPVFLLEEGDPRPPTPAGIKIAAYGPPPVILGGGT